MAKTGSQILYRFDKYKILTDTAYYDFSGNAIGQSQSDLLIYGNTGTYISSSSSATSTNDYLFRSPACMMALKYIGKGGKFNVIIPFDEEVSSAYQQDYYLTLYLENVTYTMID